MQKFTDSTIIITNVACGFTHTLALLEDGRVLSWGGSKHGKLGFGKNKGGNEPGEIKCFGPGKKRTQFK